MDKNFPRLLDTLRLVPRRRKASTAEIHQQLAALGYEVSRRTVQRDLEALALEYGFDRDDRDRAVGWSWPRKSLGSLSADVDLPQALSLLMMEQELGSLMPRAAREALEPLWKLARQRVDASGQAKASKWLKKIAFQPLGPPLMPAKESPAVLEAIIEALYAEVQVRAEYRSAQSETYRAVVVHPLGLIRTGLVSYVVVRFEGHDDARLLALHRVRRVKVLELPSVPPTGFDLATFIRDGGLNFGSGPLVRLRLRMTCEAAMHLHDTPLSEDQVIEILPCEPGFVLVQATVSDSPRLEWWIRGFGDQAKRQNGPALESQRVRQPSQES